MQHKYAVFSFRTYCHRMVNAETDLWRLSGPTALLQQEYPEHSAQVHIQAALEDLQGDSTASLESLFQCSVTICVYVSYMEAWYVLFICVYPDQLSKLCNLTGAVLEAIRSCVSLFNYISLLNSIIIKESLLQIKSHKVHIDHTWKQTSEVTQISYLVV